MQSLKINRLWAIGSVALTLWGCNAVVKFDYPEDGMDLEIADGSLEWSDDASLDWSDGESVEANAGIDLESAQGGEEKNPEETSTEEDAFLTEADGIGVDGNDFAPDSGDSDCVHTVPQAVYTEKNETVPDYTQTDPAYGGFQPDGYNFCGPTAVSNSLMWLGDNGFPNLVMHTADRKKDQHDLIVQLASPDYFNTNGEINGTPPDQLLEGLKSYIGDRGYSYSSLLFQGWCPLPLPEEFDTGVIEPDLDWVKSGAEAMSSTWLLLSLGHFDAQTNTHVIDNGHYVTLVGHGWNGSQADSAFLTVHDPWTSGDANAYTRAELITSGELRIEYPGFPIFTHSAVGYYRLVGGFEFSRPEVILLGVIRLDMPCR